MSVLHVPTITKNLVSIGQIVDEGQIITQVRWVGRMFIVNKLVGHNFLHALIFLIVYHPAIHQGKADVLSRHSYMAPCLGEPNFDHQKHILLGPDILQVMVVNAFEMSIYSILISTIRTDLEADEFAQDFFNHIIPDHASYSRLVNSRNDYNQFS